jgi:hypothetical protein
LIGGRFSDVPGTVIPVFSSSRPPYLEIQGIWKDDVNLTLSHLDNTSGQFIQDSQLNIGSSQSEKSNIIELWEHQAEPGKYKIDVLDTQVELVVASETSHSSQEYQNQVNIDLWVIDESGNRVVSQNRYELPELRLVIKSWPLANLVLGVYLSEGIYSREFSVQTNEKGEWVQDIIDLPIELEYLPPGIVTISVSWRGIFENKLDFYDKNYISKSTFEFEINLISADQFNFSCHGIILGTKIFQYLYGILLDEIPWQTSPSVIEMDVHENHFSTRSITIPWHPKWLVIVGSDSAEFNITKIFGIAVFQLDKCLTQRITNIHLDKLFNNYSRSWTYISELIEQLPHPPLIGGYLHVKNVFALLQKFRLIKKAQKKWKFVSLWNEIGNVYSLSNLGYELAIFRSKVPMKDLARSVTGIKLGIGDWSEDLEQIHLLDESGEIIGQLMKKELYDQWRISITPNNTLRGCSKCQLIVPIRHFDGHVAPYSGFIDCTGVGQAFMDLRSGTSHFIKIGILIDPELLFKSIVNQLESILAGSKEINDIVLPLIRNIRSIVPKAADLREWLEGFVVFLNETWKIVSKDYYEFGIQKKLMRDVEKYHTATDVILDFISDKNFS